ncbi:MAG: SpoIVB peptidase S55 domain-containing protein, partial [Opitutales bacterium]|nr:SpoIVB peptidase S55 domain-containing protein [Opitutales bacterium]
MSLSLAGGLCAQLNSCYELMPLEEVKPGMEGEWLTVMSGTEVETFPLRVIGIAEHFIGPNESVIICEAIDDRNILSGPVAGMSGSPVFIDGKLVGAYAYGYTWPKEQAIIGVTPIHNMLPVLEDRGGEVAAGGSINSYWKSVEPASRSRLNDFQTVLQPLPAPLIAAGISDRTLAAFSETLDELGVKVMNGPGGSASAELTGEIEAGSAVA